MDHATASGIGQVLSHVGQAVPFAAGGFAVERDRGKTTAVVPDADEQAAVKDLNLHFDTGRAGMFKNIAQRFLESQENIVAEFGGNRQVRQFAWHAHIAFHGSVVKVLPGMLAQVGTQIFQGVIVRIDGPHHFIQCSEQIP